MSVDYPLLAREISAGARVLMDDGNLELKVESVAGDEITTRVVYGGRLSSRKG